MARFTKTPNDTFKHLQTNAGVLATGFTPSTGKISGLMAATTGGITFNSNPEFNDFGEDIDNCPKNTKELKRIVAWDPVISGTMLTIDKQLCGQLIGAANVSSSGADDPYIVEPTMTLTADAFKDLWFVCDYSDDNSEESGGFVAIHLINALNTTGFQLQTTDKGKGQFSFEFHGHASIENIDKVPFEIYIKGTDEG